MGHFDNFEATQPSLGGAKFTPNFSGKVRVLSTKIFASPKQGDCWILECTPVTTNMPDVHPVGDKRSWVVPFKYPSAKGNIKAFLLSVMGFNGSTDEQRIKTEFDPGSKELANATGNPAMNPLKDLIVQLDTSHKVTEVNKKDFVVHTWGNVSNVPTKAA